LNIESSAMLLDPPPPLPPLDCNPTQHWDISTGTCVPNIGPPMSGTLDENGGASTDAPQLTAPLASFSSSKEKGDDMLTPTSASGETGTDDYTDPDASEGDPYQCPPGFQLNKAALAAADPKIVCDPINALTDIDLPADDNTDPAASEGDDVECRAGFIPIPAASAASTRKCMPASAPQSLPKVNAPNSLGGMGPITPGLSSDQGSGESQLTDDQPLPPSSSASLREQPDCATGLVFDSDINECVMEEEPIKRCPDGSKPKSTGTGGTGSECLSDKAEQPSTELSEEEPPEKADQPPEQESDTQSDEPQQPTEEGSSDDNPEDN